MELGAPACRRAFLRRVLARLPAGVFAHDVGPPAGGRFCAWCSPAYRRAFLRMVLAQPSWRAFLLRVLARLPAGVFA